MKMKTIRTDTNKSITDNTSKFSIEFFSSLCFLLCIFRNNVSGWISYFIFNCIHLCSAAVTSGGWSAGRQVQWRNFTRCEEEVMGTMLTDGRKDGQAATDKQEEDMESTA